MPPAPPPDTSAPPIPWSPNSGLDSAPAVLKLDPVETAMSSAQNHQEQEKEFHRLRRRSMLFCVLRRASAAVLFTAVLAVCMVWAVAQTWWSPVFIAWMPDPSLALRWVRQPDLAVLPGWPQQWNPWAKLTLEEPQTLLTPWKLLRLEGRPAECQAWLAAVPGSTQNALPDRQETTALQCGWTGASRISQLDSVRYSSSFPLSCGAAVALARWQRHGLQPAALAHFGSPVVRIEHLGSYACRYTNGNNGARRQLSTHASANALDISAFVLANGRRVSVLKDWAAESVQATQTPTKQSTEAAEKVRFLHAVRDSACQSFNTVLSPDYNAAHSDHFHLDRGPYRACN